MIPKHAVVYTSPTYTPTSTYAAGPGSLGGGGPTSLDGPKGGDDPALSLPASKMIFRLLLDRPNRIGGADDGAVGWYSIRAGLDGGRTGLATSGALPETISPGTGVTTVATDGLNARVLDAMRVRRAPGNRVSKFDCDRPMGGGLATGARVDMGAGRAGALAGRGRGPPGGRDMRSSSSSAG